MLKLKYFLSLYFFISFCNVRCSQGLLQCYLCADCGDPFNKNQPYTSVVTNQNYGASCIKTVLTVSYGTVVSRGTTFQCTPASNTNVKVACCQTDLCNGSYSFKQATFWNKTTFILFLVLCSSFFS